MFAIDIRTIYLGYIIISIINLILISALYFQIKKRFPGTLYIYFSFFMAALGVILIFLRDTIPDLISIPVANTFVVSSFVLLFIGLERFVNKKGVQIQNYILVFVYFLVHSYFTFIEPNLDIRNINSSLAFMMISFQIAILMLKRAPFVMRKITLALGVLFCAVFTIQLSHVIFILLNYKLETNHFNSDTSESIFLLTWEVILILLAYSIFLMYNKRLINDVNAQEEKFSKAFHAAPFIIMLSKFSDGKIFEVNNGVYPISGYQPNELIGLNTIDLQIWKNKDDRLRFLSDLKLKGIVVEDEYEFLKKSGEFFIGLVSAEIININNEQSIISIISDITMRKKTELNLRHNEASLRELNLSKDKFFSIIAHDLRSPFNSIIGFSELLNEEVRNKNYEGIDQYAEIINTSSKHAMELLSNLMEWSMSQTGRIEFNPEYFDIVTTIKSVTELLKTSAEQKLINITHNMPSKLILFADKAMLEVILRNLISNAIKFSHQNGTVIISAEEKDNEYIISVSDSGVGIEESNIEKLFRIDTSHSSVGTNNEKGTGLGLILCNDFIEKHKGKIWVESEEGVGSTFYFSLQKK